ncbi:MAG: GTPase Era [Acaryochloridaceae cyanobacterium SU_2_1]|nr:GTPase Era [Acaryochloridaceae cyanobacterium SU_2_1]
MSLSENLTCLPLAPPTFKSGFVGIVGRPNVGKSTLMNQLIGQKVAITSPVAQTTRNRLRGILTTTEAQLIFVDTPGIHKPHHQLGQILVKNARMAIHAVDVVLFIVDCAAPLGGGDRFIANLLTQTQIPIILGLNKADLQPRQNQKTLDQPYRTLAQTQGWSSCKFSASAPSHLDHLQALLVEHLPLGPYYYPPDLVTDQPERFIMGELIREQVLRLTRQEVPHSVAVSIDRVDESPDITRILATVQVERSSQKRILIGKQGTMLKAIGTEARQQIQKLITGKVYLELFVKVEPNWRQSRTQLQELGYQVDPY